MKLARALFLLAVLSAVPGWGQIWDRSGNGKLTGDYFFRETGWSVDTFGDVSNAFSMYGSLSFDGRGNYTISATFFDGRQFVVSDSGTYSIAANGYGFMEHPIVNGRLLLGIANGVLLGSSVDAGINDIFMAVPVGSATQATFNGAYSMAYFNIFASQVENHYDALAKFSANGSGNIGSVAVRAYVAGQPTTPINQTETGVRYVFQGGVGRIDFPTGQNLAIQGSQILAISPDGNLIFGGSAVGFDFYVGVRRTDGSAPDFSGLYFQTGVNLDASAISTGGAFDTYFGSLLSRNSVMLGHQRILTPRRTAGPLNYTYSADFPSAPPPEFSDTESSTEWAFSADGAIRVGLGIGPFLGIAVAVRAPTPEALSGPYVSSVGVLNGASFAPVTAGIARGQQITLFGNGLAEAFASSASVPLPTSISGVEVRINNRSAPLIYVSPGQVAAIVPYGITESIAQIQVVRNGVVSNAVTMFVYNSAPGVFAQNAQGFGYGAVLDLDYKLVTAENRVDPGEFVAIYLTGLGDVFPTVQDGAPGGTVQLNETVTDPVVRIGGKVAEVVYSGLAPGFAGLYQVNAKVPEGVAGDVTLDIEIAGGETAQTLLPVSGTATGARAITPVRR